MGASRADIQEPGALGLLDLVPPGAVKHVEVDHALIFICKADEILIELLAKGTVLNVVHDHRRFQNALLNVFEVPSSLDLLDGARNHWVKVGLRTDHQHR